MSVFELSSKKQKDGKRSFVAVLYKLQPPECVVNNVGTDGHWNKNGITFIEEYAEKNLESIKDMSITCDFLDENHTEISGHGETGEYTEDGLPIFETNIIGHFKEGYIGNYEENGQIHRVVFGKGVIDEMRNANFVKILEENIKNGIYPSGSIEILRPIGSTNIEYLNKKFEEGRIPVKYIHSGYSIILNPSDNTAKVIEINSEKNPKINERKEINMDEKILSQFVDSVKSTIIEVNSKNSEFESQSLELNAVIIEKDNKITELKTTIEELENALEDLKKEQETYWAERDVLEKEIAKLKVEKRLSELNCAISEFTDEEKNYAKTEIETFNADPMSIEVNSIVEKIYTEIGKKARNTAKDKRLSEINSKNATEDIYGDIYETTFRPNDEISIY